MPDIINLTNSTYNGKNAVVAAHLAKKSALIRTMEFNKSSNGIKDLYTQFDELAQGGFASMGEGLPNGSTNTSSDEIDLMEFGNVFEPPEKLIKQYGGLPKYIRDKSPAIIEGYGQGMARQYLYGLANNEDGFMGLIDYAKNFGMCIPVNNTGTGSDYTSLVAVTWDAAQCTGLYNEQQFAKGMFKPTILNGGKAVIVDKDGKKLTVFQYKYGNDFGLKVLSRCNIYVLSGIKEAEGYIPTAKQIDKMLEAINATPGNTVIYANGTARRLISSLNGATIDVKDHGGKVIRTVRDWDGIPVETENNIKKTEERTH